MQQQHSKPAAACLFTSELTRYVQYEYLFTALLSPIGVARIFSGGALFFPSEVTFFSPRLQYTG